MKYQLKTPILKPNEIGQAQGLRMLGQKMYGQKKFQSMMPSFSKQMSLQLTQPIMSNVVEKEFMEPEVSISGVLLIIAFCLTFIYMYSTSWYIGKITWASNDNYGITLSEAIKYSEKIGTIILLVLVSAFFTGLLLDKGFLSENSSKLKKSLISISYVFLVTFLLMFMIGPDRENQKIMRGHAFIASVILTFMAYNAIVYSYLYNDIYVNDGLIKHLTNATYALILLIVSVFVLFGLTLVFPKYHETFSKLIGISEIGILIAFVIIIGIVTVLPKLVDFESLCVNLGFEKNEK